MLAAQFRLSDAKKINSADGMMNKPTTNIYFLFFGVQNHLILHGKLSGLGGITTTLVNDRNFFSQLINNRRVACLLKAGFH